MRAKSEIELKRASIAKTVRTLERLKASLAADRAINDRLPATLAEFDAAVARGELLTMPEESLDDLVEAQ